MAGQPLKGLVGQSITAKKSFRGASVDVQQGIDVMSGSGSFVATKRGMALIYMWGAGASGGGNGLSGAGGGGAGALFKRFRISPGQAITYSVGAPGVGVASTIGNDGGDTLATLPGGQQLVAGGGKASGLAGVSTGGDINRNGGAGGVFHTAGSAGDFGGTGGSAGGSLSSGGGGGAGFSDVGQIFQGGAGSNGNDSVPTTNGGNYGGGSGSTQGGTISGNGGFGRLLILIVRAH